MVILLARRVDSHLNSDFTALDFLAIHFGASFLLKLLGAQGDETEAAALARLTTSLKLLNHETGDGTERNLGSSRRVVLENLE